MQVQIGATYLEGNLIIAIKIFDLGIPVLGIHPIISAFAKLFKYKDI